MAEYIYALTGAVLLSELCMLLMPDGTMKRFAKTAAGVMILIFLLMPLKECSVKEISFQTESGGETMYKSSYGDIIMDIYTKAMEETDGEKDA